VNYINKPGTGSIIWRTADLKQNIEDWHRAIPDIKVSIINLICDKQYVTAHYRLEGMHVEESKNRQPRGNCINVEMLDMFRIEGGKISEQWIAFDMNEILEDITKGEKKSFANHLSPQNV
jgi:predicted ester cyclase